MDFELNDDQKALRELARNVFGESPAVDGQAPTGVSQDRDLWNRIVNSDLTALGVPERLAGAGGGVVDACVMLIELGRAAKWAPILESVLVGSQALQPSPGPEGDSFLRSLAMGDCIIVPALHEHLDRYQTSRNASIAVRGSREPHGHRLSISGSKTPVMHAPMATHYLVNFEDQGSEKLGLLEADSDGVSIDEHRTTSGIPEATLHLESSEIPRDGLFKALNRKPDQIQRLRSLGRVGLAAYQLGVARGALAITADHVRQREQFGRKLSTFQAVATQLADAWIACEATEVVMWKAAWELDEGIDARRSSHVSKIWASEMGRNVGGIAQHLHGGVGVDVSYPLHRYFSLAKHLELYMGSEHSQLSALGNLISEEHNNG